ncbi:hypothetical protein OU995_20730 [Roseateles sp. SL47]|uniref:hypothetical protein n=1 Tax=Roseateles sp. SL47 TaxID=2995138 RepID=UPI002271EDD5|nr:hypothetical protein [Roseateles sp. SL47]WAC71981.1 hypothetical protein OU995_20730 [Roseateles sp. SL47]
MNPLRCATVVVKSADEAAAGYVERLDFRIIESGPLDHDLAAHWGAPQSAGRQCVVVRPASGRPVDLRFIEGDPVPGLRPLRTFGWAALELCVEDVFATQDRLIGSAFEIIGPPTANPSLPSIHPMQVMGPDGEVLYLTQVLQGGPGSGLPQAQSPVDVLFIAVLACQDLETSAHWLSRQLDFPLQDPLEIPYRMLNRAFDLPPTHRHRIVCATANGHICLELDQYPPGATPRPGLPGQLPPGIAIVTLTHPDLSAIQGPWMTPPMPRQGVVYEGRRAGVLRSPEGTLIELVESPT